ncbi:MAG: FMN-binding protein [Defluviitaleaceae bacterium]|nr:FMN-binding protein [Defluviitaleaceae bacterium]
MKKCLILTTLLAGAILLSACGSLDDPYSVWNERREAPATVPAASGGAMSFTPGVYTGVGSGGWEGDITISITVNDAGSITNIEVTDHNETEAFADRAFGYLIPAVIAAQSANVDTVSGATATSTAFIAAVQDALRQAGGVPVGGATAVSRPLTPGTFTGVGSGGWEGDITIAITVNEAGAITDIEVTDHNETEAFASRAFGELIPAVIVAQSANVDTVSGATATSTAFIAAVQDAISQAEEGIPQIDADPDDDEDDIEIVFRDDLTPGIFIGVGTGGFYGDITIAMTVSDAGAIADIEVTDHNETESFANRAFGALIPAVINAQSADVDIVVGATATSDAFIAAVQDAISQAEEDLASDIVIPLPILLIPGTFVGIGEGGWEGSITIEMTVNNAGLIADIEVTNHNETEIFANRAFAELIPAVIDAQSANVDIVSGATATSNAFIAAVEDAISQAGQ